MKAQIHDAVLGGNSQKQVICPKCKGSGYLQKYSNLDSGACFLCQSSGKIEAEKARAFKAAATKKSKSKKPEPPQGAILITGYNLRRGQKIWMREKGLKGWMAGEYSVLATAPFLKVTDGKNEFCYSNTSQYWLINQ